MAFAQFMSTPIGRFPRSQEPGGETVQDRTRSAAALRRSPVPAPLLGPAFIERSKRK